MLFVTWDGGGNLPPALGIAAGLRERGHRIRFLGHAQQRGPIEAAGFGFTPYAHARPWSSADPVASPADIISMFTDRGPGTDLLAEASREPPAAVVIDCLSLGALQAASRAGLTRAVLAHTYYRYLAGHWSPGPVGQAARLDGLHPVRLWESADLLLIATDPGLDPAPGGGWPASARQTGVVQPAPLPRDRPDGARPRVLVSLSTTFFPDQEHALQTIIDALGGLPVGAVVTTGPAIDPARLRPAASTELHGYLPHADVMPRMSLVVSHGGHATAMRALAHDLPLLIMPMHPLLDQEMIGDSVASQGAGLVLPATAPPGQIAAAVTGLLGPGPRAAAARLGAALRARDGAGQAADELAALLARTTAAR
ncbi:MAG TPA: nucleotide disphospho-sugar-binding domain-containing protein [Streptosporangiaceae bacterium]